MICKCLWLLNLKNVNGGLCLYMQILIKIVIGKSVRPTIRFYGLTYRLPKLLGNWKFKCSLIIE